MAGRQAPSSIQRKIPRLSRGVAANFFVGPHGPHQVRDPDRGIHIKTTTMANLGDQEVTEYQSIFDPHTRTRRGMCSVTQIRHQREPFKSHSLYYEVHGCGPQKIVLIMG